MLRAAAVMSIALSVSFAGCLYSKRLEIRVRKLEKILLLLSQIKTAIEFTADSLEGILSSLGDTCDLSLLPFVEVCRLKMTGGADFFSAWSEALAAKENVSQPNFRDARQNLELAQSKTEDQITPLPEFFLAKWTKSFIGWFSPAGWRVVLLIILALLGALLVFFFLCNDYRWRKNSLIGSILATCLLLIAIASAIASSTSFNRHNKAVVTEPMIVVKGSPETSSIDKLVLHEGTELDIEETLGDWHKIRIADGNTGWVQSDEITII